MTETLTLRATTAADLAEVDALFGRSYPALLKDHYPPSVRVTAIPKLARANPRLLASGSYFAVVDGAGAIVGAGGWTRGPGGIAEVRHVVTDHRRVRQGIGRALMGHIAATSGRAGAVRLECLATLMAVPFYAACGFAAVRPVTLELCPGIGFRAVQMRRVL